MKAGHDLKVRFRMVGVGLALAHGNAPLLSSSLRASYPLAMNFSSTRKLSFLGTLASQTRSQQASEILSLYLSSIPFPSPDP